MRNGFQHLKKYYSWGRRYLSNEYQVTGQALTQLESKKTILRSDVINYLLNKFKVDTTYLEIGVRNPVDNFDKINASIKFSVDPGIEFPENPVDFRMTSDKFFNDLESGTVLYSSIKFHVIFIDGLHLAEQVDRDISNSLRFLRDDGYIVLHDCNPPSEWHAREEHLYDLSPARRQWNGTTWKAFLKYRKKSYLTSTCIDSDWGIGVLTRLNKFNWLREDLNPFFEYKTLDKNRREVLNLVTFEEFVDKVEHQNSIL
jgi:hypothetical protein